MAVCAPNQAPAMHAAPIDRPRSHHTWPWTANTMSAPRFVAALMALVWAAAVT